MFVITSMQIDVDVHTREERMPLNTGIMYSPLSGEGARSSDCDRYMKHDYSSEKYSDEGYSCYA